MIPHPRSRQRSTSSCKWGGGVPPSQSWTGGIPSSLGLGAPHPVPRIPPSAGWGTTHPDLEWGTPSGLGTGYPTPHLDLGRGPLSVSRMGYPPPSGQTENITFPHTRDAGGNKQQKYTWSRIYMIIFLSFCLHLFLSVVQSYCFPLAFPTSLQEIFF